MSFRIRIALAAAVAVFGVVGALASAPQAQAGGAPCWERLLDDWVKDVRIDGTYPAACYREAIKRLKGDLRDYSSAAEDIERALSSAVSSNGGREPGIVEPPDDQREPDELPPFGEAGGPNSGGGTGNGSGGGGSNDGGIFDRLLPRATGAASVPLPLVVLAGLALLLLAAAAVSFAARHMQGRRTPVAGPPRP